jgi:DNA recombination protein RmuC
VELASLAFLLAGFALGALAAFLALRGQARAARQAAQAEAQARLSAAEVRLAERDRQILEQGAQVARREEEALLAGRELRAESERRAGLEATLEQERRAAEEKLGLLDEAREKLSDAFKALSAEVLQSSSRSFLELAKASLEKYQEGARGDLEKRQSAIAELLAPVRESLSKVDAKIGEIEKGRIDAYASLSQQVKSMAETQQALRAEAGNLVKALRTPQVRGRWGEIQLRRVVEIAGMVNYCDFNEQETVSGEAGRLRPDLVVRLPGGKSVVVDAKVPLSAYLEAAEAPSEAVRLAKLQEHARQVRDHVTALSRKSYFDQFQPAPEFVVLFLPGESFFSAALEQDPSLLEAGAGKNVVLATPTTLIALLKAVAYGWKQENLAENAREVSALGRELHKRLSDMGGHVAKLGRALSGSVEAYNATVGSLESRVLVSARRFKELEASSVDDAIEPLSPVEHAPRRLAAPELVPMAAELEGDPADDRPARGARARAAEPA